MEQLEVHKALSLKFNSEATSLKEEIATSFKRLYELSSVSASSPIEQLRQLEIYATRHDHEIGNLEHNLDVTMERLDTRNELIANVIDKLNETLRNVDPGKYSMA